jgi:hypothetical protein
MSSNNGSPPSRSTGDIRTPAREAVVDAEHLGILGQEKLTQMGADKTRAARHENTLPAPIKRHLASIGDRLRPIQ